MFRIVGIGLSVIRQDGEIPRLRDAQPCPLFRPLQVSRGQDLLVVGSPPVRSAGGSSYELIAVVEDDEGVGGMCSGGNDYAHFGGVCNWMWRSLRLELDGSGGFGFAFGWLRLRLRLRERGNR